MVLRRVFLTWNNWKEEFKDKEEVELYFKQLEGLRYYVIGFEVGESGTEHLQGVIGFKKAHRFNKLRKMFKNNHIEKVKVLDKAIEYCKKDGDYIKYGEVVFERERTDLAAFRDAILEGYSNLELADEYPSQYFSFHKSIEQLRQEVIAEYYSNNLRKDLKVFYLYGETGTGKTRFIYDNYKFKDVYRISDYKNPFDNYKGEKTIVFDEFRSDIKFSEMLNLLDIYPTELRARYNNKVAAYHEVYIISNWNWEEQYFNIQEFHPLSWKALERRINGIYEITHDNDRNKRVFKEIQKTINKTLDLPF